MLQDFKTEKVSKRQKCLLYKCWEISKRGRASDAPSPVEYRQAALAGVAEEPCPWVWGVFEVIKNDFRYYFKEMDL